MKQNNHPDNCGCCEGIEQLTPLSIANRPGLDVLAYRVGTYASFLETMQARLSTLCLGDEEACREGKGQYPLKSLTTRDEDDPAIALLHGWANVADVLTFYQERIANEGYLRTATERRSILELARLVGYKLRPGVSATAYLAFEMEKDSEEEIPAGTRAKSTPGPNELPQPFETTEPLPARYEWNALKPRQKRPQYIVPSNAEILDTIYFEGIATNLKPNDPLLLLFGKSKYAPKFFRQVETVTTDPVEDLTIVTLQEMDMEQVFLKTTAAIQQTLEKHQKLEAFGVSESTQMARRVVSTMSRFTDKLSTGQTFEELKGLFEEELPLLKEEQAIAEEGDYSRLGPWVTGLVAELGEHENSLNRTGLTAGKGRLSGLLSMSEGEGNGDGNGDEEGAPPLTPLVGLLSPLLQPPSEQPAHARRLRRDLQTIFATESDTVPRLLTTFKPKLKDTLYAAWANAEFTKPPALSNALAPRIKASPFGHNAPLKPIFDEEGVIIGQEEWPLIGSVAIRVDLSRYQYGGVLSGFAVGSLIADIAVTLGSEQLKARVNLGSSLEINLELDGVRVDITLEMNDSITKLTFHFTGSLESGGIEHPVDKTLSIEPDDEFTMLSITIDDNPDSTRSIEPGYKVSFPFDSSKVTLSFENEDEFFLLDQSLIAPTALNVVALDAEYNQITPGSWVAIKRPGEEAAVFQVLSADTVSLAAYGISGKVTQLTLNGDWLTTADILLSALRQTTIYAQSEKLALADEPIIDDVAGDSIELDALYDGLEAGRWVIVSGERTDIGSNSTVRASELMMLAAVTQGVYQLEEQVSTGASADLPGDKTHTFIHFPNDLAYTYKRETVIIYGNVAHATHGETVREVLGSGNGSQVFQSFMLKQSPLTFLAAPTAAGAETTLEVRVNDVLWHEAENLFELERNDRGYITRTDNDAKTAVTFGNGHHGARLPTGAENVKALYRFGIGQPGNVAAQQIDQLATRPLGVKGVINPLATSGGADRENRDQARQNVPLAVISLDRLVSLPDYADFARTFAGIGKASATRLSDGQRELVHLTIAGADDIPIETNSDLYRNLCQALHQLGDPYLPIRVELRELIILVISAQVRLLPDYQWISLEPKIRAVLLDTFSFTRRQLGQDALLSEAISAIQHLPGIAYVDIDLLGGIPEAVVENAELLVEELDKLASFTDQPKQRIPAQLARPEEGQIRPAQLAILVPELPETITLTELT